MIARLALFLCLSTLALGARCFCGNAGVCRFVKQMPLPEACDQCSELSGLVYRRDCRTMRDYCQKRPCQNMGRCIPVFGWYYCACPTNYFGPVCENYSAEPTRRLVHPVVYFPLNVPTNVERVIRVGVKEFGDKFKAVVTFSYGTNYSVDEYAFDRENVRSPCLEFTREFPDQADKSVCFLLPNQEINVHSITHHPVKSWGFGKDMIEWNNSVRIEEIGMTESVTIVLYNDIHVSFNRTYSLVTPLNAYDDKCSIKIDFVGCSLDIKDPAIYQQHEKIVVLALPRVEDSCFPLTEYIRVWYHHQHASLIKLSTETTKKLAFSPNSLSAGFHEFHFEFGIQSDPPHYGSTNVIKNFGICWLQVVHGPMLMAIEGGEKQTYPCYQPMKLSAMNLNKNLRVEDMNFTWSCSEADDPRCARVHFQGSAEYPENDKGCGLTYNFTIFVKQPAENVNTTLTAEITFDPRAQSRLEIICETNCQRLTVAGRSAILRVKSTPFVPGGVTFNVTINNQTFDKSQVELRATNQDPVVFFPGRVINFTEPTNLTLTVYKLNDSAKYTLTIRPPPVPPNCSVGFFAILTTVVCEPYSNAENYGMFFLYESLGRDDIRDVFSYSSSGQYVVLYPMPALHVVFVDFYGVASDSSTFYINTTVPLGQINDTLTKHDECLKEGDFINLLHAISRGSRLYHNDIVVHAMTDSQKQDYYVFALLIMSSDLFKMQLFDKEGDIEMALNIVTRLLEVSVESPIKSSQIRCLLGEIVHQAMHQVKKIVHNDLILVFRHETLTKRNIVYLSDIVKLLTLKDPFILKSDSYRLTEHRQYMKRIAEACSDRLLQTLEALAEVDQAQMAFMSDPITYVTGDDDEETMPTVHFGMVGTMEYISGKYSSFDFQALNLFEYTFPGMNDPSQNPVLFQIYLFFEEIFWWHRYFDIHSVVVKATLQDFTTKLPIPNSVQPFELRIPLLDKYGRLLNGSSFSGFVANAKKSSPQRTEYVVTGRFTPPMGKSTVFYKFTECETPCGCRIIHSYDRIPNVEDFSSDSVGHGSFTVEQTEEETAKYYFSVLPGEQEDSDALIKFTLQFQIASCMSWEDYRYVEYCDLIAIERYDDTSIAVCQCNRMTWFATTIPKIDFQMVMFSNLNVTSFYHIKLWVASGCIFTLLLFILLFFWCRFMDRKENKKNLLKIMKTTSPINEHEFIIGFFTRPSTITTSSKVCLRLIGSASSSSVGLVTFGFPKAIVAAEDDWFTMASNHQIGRLEEIHLWHDHSGCAPAWHCEKIEIFDVRQNELYLIAVAKQLTVGASNDPMLVETANKVAHGEGLSLHVHHKTKDYWAYFVQNFRLELANKHRTLSFYFKSPRNIRTRLECLSVFAVFFSTIISVSLIIWRSHSGVVEVDLSIFTPGIIFQTVFISLAVAYVPPFIISELHWIAKGNRIRASVNVSRRTTAKSQSKSSSVGSGSKKKSETRSFYSRKSALGDQFRHIFQSEAVAKKTRGKKKMFRIRERFKKRLIKFFSLFVHPIFYNKVMHESKRQSTPTSKFLRNMKRFTWCLTVGIIVGNIIVTVFYGTDVPRVLSFHWIKWALIMLVFDAVVVDPLKITFYTLILLDLLKKSDVEVNTVFFDPVDTFETKESLNHLEFIRDRTQRFYKTMSWDRMQRIRNWHKWKKVAFFAAFFTAAFLVILLLSVRISSMETKLSYLSIEFLKIRLNEEFPRFTDVHSKALIPGFVLNNFIPKINVRSWYNDRIMWRKDWLENKEVTFERSTYSIAKGLAFNHDMVMIGPFRVRQQRVEHSLEPDISFQPWFNASYSDIYYSVLTGWENVDMSEYCENWQQIKGCLPKRRAWLYTPPAGFFPQKAVYSWFPTEGYMRTISWSKRLSKMTLMNIGVDNWIDNRTRVVSLDFNIFNLNLNLLVSGSIIVETLLSGISMGVIEMEVFQPSLNGDFPKETISDEVYVHYWNEATQLRHGTIVFGFIVLVVILAVLYSFNYIFAVCRRLKGNIVPILRVCVQLYLLLLYFAIITGRYLIDSSSIDVAYWYPLQTLLKEFVDFKYVKFVNIPVTIFFITLMVQAVCGLAISYYVNLSVKGMSLKSKIRPEKGPTKKPMDVILEHVVTSDEARKRLKALNDKFEVLKVFK